MSIVDKMRDATIPPIYPNVNVDGWRLLRQASGYFLFCLGSGGINKCGLDPSVSVASGPPGSVVTGMWYHVAAVKTSTSLALYVNGVLANQSTALGSFTDTNSTDSLIGANIPEGARTNGLIDEVTLTTGRLPPLTGHGVGAAKTGS